MEFRHLLLEVCGKVGLITLHRPEARNALSLELREELRVALRHLEQHAEIGAIVITGNDHAFAAGADVKAIKDWSYLDAANSPSMTAAWDQLTACRKPVIAAVAGYALGAGCELAMMCDFILAADTAKFGQPEIKVGTIPGAGGTQRLARALGKAKAMEMVLTGRVVDAEEAERCGLVSRIVPAARLVEEAVKTAARIGQMSLPAAMMAKEAINRAFETPLAEGLLFERKLFHATFILDDRKEGMAAFLEKRDPRFSNR